MAARVALDGTASEPVLQRPRIDLEGRLVCCPDPPDVVAIGDGWTLLWSEGYRTDSVTSRNIFSARIGTAGPVSIDTPRLMTYRAASQQLVGTAHHGDVVLVVWQEPYGQPLTYAARFTVAGRRIDAHDIVLGAIEPRAVRATPSGFAVLGLHQIVRIDANDGTVASSESPAPLMDLSCAGGMCLAAWVASTGAVGPAAIRVSRWRDGVLLDAPGMVVHFSDTLYHDLEMANDGERFLVAFARQVAPGGSILSVARVDPAGGEWRIRTSDLAASSWGINSLRLVFEGDGYIAAWHALPWRASRWTRDGDAVDGDETGYEGWPVENPVDQLVYDGARTLIVSGSTLFELQGRVPVAIQTWPGARAVAIECVAPRVCATVTQEIVRGRQWYEAERLLFRGAVTKVRAVRPR